MGTVHVGRGDFENLIPYYQEIVDILNDLQDVFTTIFTNCSEGLLKIIQLVHYLLMVRGIIFEINPFLHGLFPKYMSDKGNVRSRGERGNRKR